jgi:glycosyltransferase involved in cell wall biosynthesis
MAAGDPRIRFLGRVSDGEVVDLYANALAVVFVPLREDFGLVTLEAFLAGKPVITCKDSGEPARMVRDGMSGLVTLANPVALAQAMDALVQEPQRAAAMGLQGQEDIRDITWEKVGYTLMSALGFGGVQTGTAREAAGV